MYKLQSIYNEIRLIGKNQFPKNINWAYKINTKEEGIKILNILQALNYVWLSFSKIHPENDIEKSIELYSLPFLIIYEKLYYNRIRRTEVDLDYLKQNNYNIIKCLNKK